MNPEKAVMLEISKLRPKVRREMDKGAYLQIEKGMVGMLGSHR